MGVPNVGRSVTTGDLLPGEAATLALADIVEVRRKAVEMLELEQRIAALEGKNDRTGTPHGQAGRNQGPQRCRERSRQAVGKGRDAPMCWPISAA